MKYEIIKNSVDDYSLKYKDKEIKLRSSVELAEKIQRAEFQARIKLVQDLAARGLTLKELVKETKKDGKTYVDNSNKEEMENLYISEAKYNIFQECITKMVGMSFDKLAEDIGLETEEEGIKLGEDLSAIISGAFPR